MVAVMTRLYRHLKNWRKVPETTINLLGLNPSENVRVAAFDGDLRVLDYYGPPKTLTLEYPADRDLIVRIRSAGLIMPFSASVTTPVELDATLIREI